MDSEIRDSSTEIKPKGRGLAIASLMLGIISIIFSILVFGFLFGIFAIVLGFIAINRIKLGQEDKSGRKFAVIGITTGSLSIIFPLMFFIVILIKEGGILVGLELFCVLIIIATVIAVFVIARLLKESPADVFIYSGALMVFSGILLKLTGTAKNIKPVTFTLILIGIPVLMWLGFIVVGATKLYKKKIKRPLN